MKHCYIIILLCLILCLCSEKENKQRQINNQSSEDNNTVYTAPINPVEAAYKRNKPLIYSLTIKTKVMNVGGEVPLIISSKFLIKPTTYFKNRVFEVLIKDFEGYILKDDKKYYISQYTRYINKTLYIYLNEDNSLGKVRRKNKYSPVIKDIGIRLEDIIKLSFVLCSGEKEKFEYRYHVPHFFNRLKIDVGFIFDTKCQIERSKGCFYKIYIGGLISLENKNEKDKQENRVDGTTCLNSDSIINYSDVNFSYSLKTRLGMKNIDIDRKFSLQLKLLEN